MPSTLANRMHAPTALWLLALAGGTLGAQQIPTTQPATPVLLWPTQGRPAFVPPGGTLATMVQPADPGDELRFELVSTRPPAQRYQLTPLSAEPPADGTYRLAVPNNVAERTYDLEVRGTAGTTVGRHAVAVARLDRRVRLVHLGDMHVGELGVPDFDQRLIDEVNLVAPTLIVATGDYLDVTHPNPDAGWRRLSDYLARFDAPVLLACGDHDDVALYCRYMAPSPIGPIELGAYRGLVLYDLPARPVSDDAEQVAWIERELSETRPQYRMTFIVAHDSGRALLDHWQQTGTLATLLGSGRVGLWLAGGWTKESADAENLGVGEAASTIGLRTPPASTTTRLGALGVSHYRVIDLEGERVTLYGPAGSAGLPTAIPVGRLQLSLDGPNDGSRSRAGFTVLSTLPFRLDHLAVRVLVRQDGERRPWCDGGRIERADGVDGVWDCRVAIDVPDKGTVRAVVGTGPPPPRPDIVVRFAGPRTLTIGPDCVVSDEWTGTVELLNRGPQAAEIMPLLRLDGEPVAYRVREEDGPLATAYRLRLAARQSVTLQPDLLALRIEPGRRELQVYLSGAATAAPVCWPLDVGSTP